MAGELIMILPRNDTSVVQQAGHPGDLCLLPDWIIKRTDITEISQYENNETPGVAPDYRGPFFTVDEMRAALKHEGVTLNDSQQQKVLTMSEGIASGGRGFMLLENATSDMVNPALRDLKLGKYSASRTDQERHGVTGICEFIKIVRHAIMDHWSGSRARGFRDENRWKTSKTGDNLSELTAMLDTAGQHGLSNIRDNLHQLQDWVNESNVIYVGMSVLVVVDPPPNDSGKAMAIDFEHPMRGRDDSFETHKSGLLEGLVNLRVIVNNYISPTNPRF